MARIGSSKNPAVVRVCTEERAQEIVALCNKRRIDVIVGIEPDQPEDTHDLELALSRSKTVAAGAKVSRHKLKAVLGSGEERLNAPVPKRRIDFAALPPEVQRLFSAPQCAAFADAEFTVDDADIQVSAFASGEPGNMANAGGADDTHKANQTNIRLRLSDPRDSWLSGGRRKRYSFSVTSCDQRPIGIRPSDTVRLVFVAAFAEKDAPDSPRMPWHPIILENCATGQYVMFGTVPHLISPPLLRGLKIAIGLMLAVGLGLAAYAPHRQHRISFFAGALGCMALALWLKWNLRLATASAKRRF